MFERFSEGARRVVVAAEEEARSLKHERVGTEHILLGLLLERGGVVSFVLMSMKVTVDRVRADALRIVNPGAAATARKLALTERAMHVLNLKPPSSGAVGGWGRGFGVWRRFRGNVGASLRCQWAFWGARAVAEGVE